MFRAFDIQEKKWVKDGVFLSSCGENFLSPDSRFIVVQDIELADKYDKTIFEKDILKCESNGVVGVVEYIREFATFVLLDYKENKYYLLDTKVCNSELIIIGNIFENPELIEV